MDADQAGARLVADGGLLVRPMTLDDDLDEELDLRHRAFGPIDGEREQWLAELRGCIAEGRLFGAFEGSQLVGAARYYDMRQWWHGRVLPMAGVAGVKVAPEMRGRGVGRALMVGLIEEIARRGYALSALYPATAHMYRQLGWEVAGGYFSAEIPGRTLASMAPPDPQVLRRQPGRAPVRRAGPLDAEQVIEAIAAVYAAGGDCGPCTFDAGSVSRRLARPDSFAYLADDGFAGYGWGRAHREMVIDKVVAGSADTARTLWGIIGSHTTVVDVVRATLGPNDPVLWLLREAQSQRRRYKMWMLRVIDAQAAIAGRGFPAAVQASLDLVLADPECRGNSGSYTIAVGDGKGSMTECTDAERAGSAIRLGPRGFAALFAGTPMSTLRVAGLVTGGEAAADDVVNSVFAATPYMLEIF